MSDYKSFTERCVDWPSFMVWWKDLSSLLLFSQSPMEVLGLKDSYTLLVVFSNPIQCLSDTQFLLAFSFLEVLAGLGCQ